MTQSVLKPAVEHQSDRLAVVADRAAGKTTAALARYDLLKERHAAPNLLPVYVTPTHAEAMDVHAVLLNLEKFIGKEKFTTDGLRNFMSLRRLSEQLSSRGRPDVVLIVDHLSPEDNCWILDRLPEIESRANVVSITVFSAPGLLIPDDQLRPWSVLRMSLAGRVSDIGFATRTCTQIL